MASMEATMAAAARAARADSAAGAQTAGMVARRAPAEVAGVIAQADRPGVRAAMGASAGGQAALEAVGGKPDRCSSHS